LNGGAVDEPDDADLSDRDGDETAADDQTEDEDESTGTGTGTDADADADTNAAASGRDPAGEPRTAAAAPGAVDPDDPDPELSPEIVVLHPRPGIRTRLALHPALPVEIRTSAQRAVLAGAAVLTVVALVLTVWATKDGPIGQPVGSSTPTVRSLFPITGPVRPSPSPKPTGPALVTTSGSEFTVAGDPPVLAWPAYGQAALDVEGLGPLGSSGADETPSPIASIAKTMTAYVVLIDHPLSSTGPGPTITITPAEAAAYPAQLAAGDSLVMVKAGEQITERQALDALMLASADNIAQILAAWDAGSVPAFVTKMNALAGRMGMNHTTYTDPSGLAPSTISTAPDQLVLGEAAMRDETFAAIVGQTSARVPVQGTVRNWNRLVGAHGVIGIKTGSTLSAGGCLLFAATTTAGGRTETIVGDLLGVPGTSSTILPNALGEAEKLIVSAQRAIRAVTVITPGSEVADVRTPGRPDLPLTVASPVTVVGWAGITYRIDVVGTPQDADVIVTLDGADSPVATVPLGPAVPAAAATPSAGGAPGSAPGATAEGGAPDGSDTINPAH
jgi:serine-type D-Ala-D-Ala carboxypeptidase (penicillin-binding protein 5/6)